MEELQRRLQSKSERILNQANAHLEHLKQQEIQCMDSISKKVFHTSFVASPATPEIVRLREQKSFLKKEMKFVQVVIATFDSHANIDDAYHSSVAEAFRSLSHRTTWNKDFVLSLLLRLFTSGQKISPSWIKNAPESIRCDRDINFCYMNTTDFDYSFLANIPTHLWEDKDIVVVAVKHFPEVLRPDDHGQSRVPHRFLDDEDVFLAFAHAKRRVTFHRYRSCLQDVDIRRLLPRFSIRIRADSELMHMLVEKSSLCASHVDQSLMENLEFRGFVLERTIGESLEGHCEEFRYARFIGSSTRRDQGELRLLLQQLAFHSNIVPMLVRFLDQGDSDPGRAAVYLAAPDHLQRHPDIVYAMLRKGHLSVDQIPETVHPRGRDFWLNASHRVDSSLWRQLPNQYKNDPEFLRTFRFINQSAIETALYDDTVPGLAENRAFWTAVFESRLSWDIDMFRAHAPLEIHCDRDFMLFACTQDAMLYACCDASLQGEEAILTAAIEAIGRGHHSDLFFSIPQHVQSMYPHLTAVALRAQESAIIRLDQVAWDLHSNLEVMKAYVESNEAFQYANADDDYVYWVHELPDAMKNNQDFGLFIARHSIYARGFRAYVSEELRSDKDFMVRVVAENPLCLAAGVGDLAKDFDLAVIAVGQDCDNRDLIGREKQGNAYKSELEFLYSVATKAREQVIAYDGFTKGFLLGLNDNPGPECKLPMLIQDNETSTSWKKTIVEFVDVPIGKNIHQLRAASLRLVVPRDELLVY